MLNLSVVVTKIPAETDRRRVRRPAYEVTLLMDGDEVVASESSLMDTAAGYARRVRRLQDICELVNAEID